MWSPFIARCIRCLPSRRSYNCCQRQAPRGAFGFLISPPPGDAYFYLALRGCRNRVTNQTRGCEHIAISAGLSFLHAAPSRAQITMLVAARRSLSLAAARTRAASTYNTEKTTFLLNWCSPPPTPPPSLPPSAAAAAASLHPNRLRTVRQVRQPVPHADLRCQGAGLAQGGRFNPRPN